MDRRQQKTREAIYCAFSRLLETRRFENLTVQDIIDEANVGRSTFYAHFETKDALLREMCTEIFHHVFNEHLPREKDHDYSSGSSNLELKLGHILYHLRESRYNLKGILRGESSVLFLQYFKEYLHDLFAGYPEQLRQNVPAGYQLHHLVGSFAETVVWWMEGNTDYSPEQMAAFYMAVIGQADGN